MTAATRRDGGAVQPFTYKGQTVITTERLAAAFGTGINNLQVNQSRNPERFEEGVHFFKIKGAELRAFKDSLTDSKIVDPRAPALILWTERGAMNHAKILETPEAWQVFGQLVDTYFAVKAGKLLPAPVVAKKLSPRYRDWLACAKLIGIKGTQAIVAANRATKETGVNVRI